MMHRPTMDDVAAAAGVSRALVSMVLNGSDAVSDKRRDAVLAAAASLGYRLNAAARTLASSRTRTIGFLIDDLRNPFFAEVAEGLEQAARAEGYRVLINTGHRQPDLEKEAVETFLELRADGLVLSSESLGVRGIAEVGSSVPTVIVGRPIFNRAADTVYTDDRLGGALATRHLVELGHRAIAHLAVGLRSSSGVARRQGYVDVLTEYGLPQRVQAIRGETSAASVARAVDRLLDAEPEVTGIFAANDVIAYSVTERLRSLGYEVPRDFSVVGYDNIAIPGVESGHLTTVSQPSAELGRLAFTHVSERLAGRTESSRAVLSPTLVARRSSAPPRS